MVWKLSLVDKLNSWLSLTTGCFIYILDMYLVQILFHSYFDLVSWLLALEATEPISEPVIQMAVEIINIHLISV